MDEIRQLAELSDELTIEGYSRFSATKSKNLIQFDHSVKIIRIRDINCCESLKEFNFSSYNPFP
jgi:hypothetical protein